jgi:hypothetical protein
MAKAPSGTRIFTYLFFGALIIGSIIIAIPKSNVTPKTPAPGKAIYPANQYLLKIGESKTVRGIKFGFLNVESDERCVGNDCASEGRATLIFRVFRGTATEDIRVNSDEQGYFENFTLRVIQLTPNPVVNLKDASLLVEIKQQEAQ